MSAPDLSQDTLYVGTSWKMNKTRAQAREFITAMSAWQGVSGVQAFVLPPLTALHEVTGRAKDKVDVWVGAQNGHFAANGAYTGEVSMRQLADAGAAVVEIGHAERRAQFSETDESVALKVRAALDAGLTPVVCIGESALLREQGGFVDFVMGQALQAMSGVSPDEAAKVLLAYEPVWAIGDEGQQATPHAVADVIASLHSAWPMSPVIYGGSVDAGNARDYLDLPGCGGIFVGRAAWEPEGFLELLGIARHVVNARKEIHLST